MRRICFRVMIAVIAITVCLWSSGCFRRSGLGLVYLIHEDFEGTVVVEFGSKKDMFPEETVFEVVVPKEGIARVPFDISMEGQIPRFYLVDSSGDKTSIELLYRWGPEYDGVRSVRDISPSEKKKKFVMLYDTMLFKISGGSKTVRARNFMVGKPTDLDRLYTEKEQRLADFQRSFLR